MGVRSGDSIKLKLGKISTDAPASVQSTVPTKTLTEEFRDAFQLPTDNSCFAPRIEAAADDWAGGAIFYPVYREEDSGNFSRLQELSDRYSGKPEIRQIGRFIMTIDSETVNAPPAFNVMDENGRELASFYIDRDTDEESVINIVTSWGEELRVGNPEEQRQELLDRNNTFITWAFNTL